MTRRIQTAILGDGRLFREALSSRLAWEGEIEVVGVGRTVHGLLTRLQRRQVDVLLVHLSTRSTLTLELVFDVKALMPATRVVVLGCQRGKVDTVDWIEAGAMAWLDHEATYESLLSAIRDVSAGRTLCSPDTVTGMIRRIAQLHRANHNAKALEREPLSDRESDVAQLMRLGLINKEIARSLGIKQPTVKSHVSQVLRKLRVEHRSDLDPRRRRRSADGG